MISRRGFCLVVLALVAGITALVSVPAQANIAVTPTLVLIEGRQRYADLNIVNVTNERQTYEISWKYLRMEEGTGEYRASDVSTTPFDVPSNISFTPRRVTVPPKGAQRVRFSLRLKGDQPPAGDYRAHILLNNKAIRGEQEVLADRESQASVSMNLGFSIPVVYRVGDSNGGSGTIGNISTEINPKTNRIEAVIPITRKEGPYGVMGTLLINYDGKTVGYVGNANIFPEVKERVFRVPLSVQQLSGGSLDVVFKHYDKTNTSVFDRKSVSIGR